MNQTLNSLKILALALVIGLGLNYVSAFTAPTTNPPAGNTIAALNTGSVGQTKKASLIIEGLNSSNAVLSPSFLVLNGNVGIGLASPSTKLDVNGQVKIRGGSPAAGKVLTSDANGLATWQTPVTGGGSVTVAQAQCYGQGGGFNANFPLPQAQCESMAQSACNKASVSCNRNPVSIFVAGGYTSCLWSCQ